MDPTNNGRNNISDFDFQRWRERFLREILYVVAVVGFIGVVVYIFTSQNIIYNIISGTMYAVFLFFVIFKVPHTLRAVFFLAMIYIAALTALLDTAAISSGSLFFLGLIALSVLVISPLAGWIAAAISLTTVAVIGWFFINMGMIPWTATAPTGSIGDWAQTCLYLVILAITVIRGIAVLQQSFVEAQHNANIAVQNLKTEQASLTSRIEDATNDLLRRTNELELTNRTNARRAEQFEAISQILSSVAPLRSTELLLPRVAESISQQYGYYHVGIFLNDPDNQYAILRATNSPGGHRMLARDHRLKIGEQGMVGYVTQTGIPRIALDVGEESIFFNNPDLPETKSEMTLPLKLGNSIIGALDIQSVEPSAFNEEDIRILSALANQVSLAIENAQLFEQTRRSLGEAEALSRQYFREGWNRLMGEEKVTGFRYTKQGSLILASDLDSESEKDQERIDFPILLRGERLGSLIIYPKTEDKLTEDQKEIVKAVAERIALSTENARLFSEVSRRAERERTVSQITTNIRSTTDPRLMIQIALDELKKALNVNEIEIRSYHSEETDEILDE